MVGIVCSINSNGSYCQQTDLLLVIYLVSGFWILVIYTQAYWLTTHPTKHMLASFYRSHCCIMYIHPSAFGRVRSRARCVALHRCVAALSGSHPTGRGRPHMKMLSSINHEEMSHRNHLFPLRFPQVWGKTGPLPPGPPASRMGANGFRMDPEWAPLDPSESQKNACRILSE